MLNDFHVLISSAHTLFGVLSASVICSVKVKLLVTLSYRTLGDCMGCSLPGSSVHGILQARILDWVAIPSSRGSSWPTDWTQVSCTAVRFFTIWAIRKAHHLPMSFSKIFALFILIWRSLYMWVISTHIYCVIHNKLWKILKEMGIPDHLTCLSRNLYAGQEATVRNGHGTLPGATMGDPTHDKGHAEETWQAKVDQASRDPPESARASTPKPESVCLAILCLSPTLLTLTGGYPRPSFSGKSQLRALVNGHDRSVSIQTPLMAF